LTENLPDILIIEDDVYSVEFMLDALKKHCPADSIKVFHDGAEVLNYLFSGRNPGHDSFRLPKLIFLDLKLPRVNGFEVLRQIKTCETTKTIPIVVFTSSTDDGDRIESYRLGTNSYIVKPVAYESFIKTVVEIGSYWTSLNMPLLQ
jgi:DNA-binding response OmpR family regulator